MTDTPRVAYERFIEGNRWRIDTGTPEFLRPGDPGPEHNDQTRILAMLRHQYTPEPIPPCPVCGAELTVGRMGGGDATRYACPNSGLIRARTPEERDAARDHYSRSQFVHRHDGDGNALAMLDVIEAIIAAPGAGLAT